MPIRLSLLSDYDACLAKAKKVVSEGGLFAYPTDTHYGIGCDALSEEAVERVYSAKLRERGKPLQVIVSDFAMLREYCEIDVKRKKTLVELLPGPYAFILPLKKRLPVSGNFEVGVRVPEHAFARQVCSELGMPIVTTSANLSGGRGVAEARELPRAVVEAVDLVVDGGRCKYGQGSTVIDLIRMKVLRRGAVREGDKIEWAD